MSKNIWNRFLEFETKNDLFSLKVNGIYIWDIIRFDIYMIILRTQDSSGIENANFNKNSIINKLCMKFTYIKEFIKLVFLSKESSNLFYLCSRNVKDGKLFDQNAKTVYDFLKKDSIGLESYITPDLKYFSGENCYLSPQNLFRKIYKYQKNDFSLLLSLIYKEFGVIDEVNNSLINLLIKNYSADYRFFTWLLKSKKIKKVFLTQNGIQKGLIGAARNMSIPVFEFQHGIVNSGHLAYNYPNIGYYPDAISLPNKILSFSDFWFKDTFLPNVDIISIGNDYFFNPLEKIKESSNFDCEDILVISSSAYGVNLAKFILECLECNLFLNVNIYFKLHPNQFSDKVYYINLFSDYKNVNIISNEMNIPMLIEKTLVTLVVVSTAIYEALQVGRCGIILKRQDYMQHEYLIQENLAYVVDSVDDFYQIYISKINRNTENRTVFFSPFNINIYKELFNL